MYIIFYVLESYNNINGNDNVIVNMYPNYKNNYSLFSSNFESDQKININATLNKIKDESKNKRKPNATLNKVKGKSKGKRNSNEKLNNDAKRFKYLSTNSIIGNNIITQSKQDQEKPQTEGVQIILEDSILTMMKKQEIQDEIKKSLNYKPFNSVINYIVNNSLTEDEYSFTKDILEFIIKLIIIRLFVDLNENPHNNDITVEIHRLMGNLKDFNSVIKELELQDYKNEWYINKYNNKLDLYDNYINNISEIIKYIIENKNIFTLVDHEYILNGAFEYLNKMKKYPENVKEYENYNSLIFLGSKAIKNI